MIYGSGFRRTPAGSSPNSATLPAHVQVNLSGVYHLWRESRYGLALRFDVINLFYTRYEIQDRSNLGAGPAQWAIGRGFYAGVEQSF